MAKKGRTGNKNLCSGIHKLGGIFGAHAAVYLDKRVGPAVGVEHLAGSANLVKRGGNKGLTRKTGVHAHEQQHVHICRQPARRAHIRARVESKARLAAHGTYGREGALGVFVGLGVDNQHVGPGLVKIGNVAGGVIHHEVHVKKKPADRPQGLDQRGSKGDVGHKGPVHHIQMQPGDTSSFKSCKLFGQSGKIGRKQRGR